MNSKQQTSQLDIVKTLVSMVIIVALLAITFLPAVTTVAAPGNGNGDGTDTGTTPGNGKGNGKNNTTHGGPTCKRNNKNPEAVADSFSLNEDSSVSFAVLANDSDRDSALDPAAVTITDAPVYGTASVDTTTGAVTYTPDADFNGSDSFSYTVTDVCGAVSNVAAASITVNPINDAPHATADNAVTNEDFAVSIDVSTNDNDVEGVLDLDSVAIVAIPANGAVSVDGAGLVTYTPAADFFGGDSFSYTINDDAGAVSSVATVSVTVNPVNDEPEAADDVITTNEDTDVSFDVTANDSDIDGNLDASTLAIVGGPAQGSLNFDGGIITYTPDADYNGSDSFVYEIRDNDGAAAQATVSMTINPVNDAPEAADDVLEMNEDSSASFDVAANDSDVEDGLDLTSVKLVDAPTNGTVSFEGSMATYTPDADFFGMDSFTYQIADVAGTTAQAAVSITVNDVPDLGVFNLYVSQDGIYRVTYEELAEAGYDLAGAAAGDIALTNRGASIAIRVGGGDSFGPGSYLEFYGVAEDSLYTDTNVYKLMVDPSQTSRIATDGSAPAGSAALTYRETATYAPNTGYATHSPFSDPWYASRMLVYTTPKTWTYELTVSDLVSGSETVTLDMYAGIFWSGSPYKHVIISLNGTQIADVQWIGKNNRYTLPAGLVQEGVNTLEITMSGDDGHPYDALILEAAHISYQRQLVAQNGALTFSGAADAFSVNNLPSSDVVAYRIENGQATELTGITLSDNGDGTFSANVPGSSAVATYFVAAASALNTPEAAAARPETDITSGGADYLVISYADFLSGLQPLVDAREAQGYSVKVVDVADVYEQFSGGVFDGYAVRDYITYAVNNLGTQMVLLVGGDTRDYHNYASTAQSYVPTLYAQSTFHTVRFTPSDPLLADVDGDLVPDVPLGRFPVRNTAELDAMVAKTLAYDAVSYGQSAALAADRMDASTNYDFGADSDAVASHLTGWATQSLHMDDMDAATARTTLVNVINEGTALTVYHGHGSMAQWSSDPLFGLADAAGLTNNGLPTVVTSYGSWSNYFVQGGSSTLLHELLLAGNHGAAAMMGIPTVAEAGAQAAFSELVTKYLAQPGMTLGGAVQAARDEMSSTKPWYTDQIQGWNILGDPALVINK